MWLDSHCHVTADKFDEDRAEVLDRASEAGVEVMVAIGSGYGAAGNARQAVALAESDERVYATVGVHPHEANELDDDLRAQASHLAGPRPRRGRSASAASTITT